jgi:hypothetical protein
LILASTAASFAAAPSSPEVTAAWDDRATAEYIAQAWGTSALAEFTNPDAARDPAFVRWFGRACRLSYSPRDAGMVIDWVTRIDVRDALGSVRVPTLVLHRVSRLLRSVRPERPVEVERKRLAADLLADVRRLDRELAAIKQRTPSTRRRSESPALPRPTCQTCGAPLGRDLEPSVTAACRSAAAWPAR